jgi:hypothetical protein
MSISVQKTTNICECSYLLHIKNENILCPLLLHNFIHMSVVKHVCEPLMYMWDMFVLSINCGLLRGILYLVFRLIWCTIKNLIACCE